MASPNNNKSRDCALHLRVLFAKVVRVQAVQNWKTAIANWLTDCVYEEESVCVINALEYKQPEKF